MTTIHTATFGPLPITATNGATTMSNDYFTMGNTEGYMGGELAQLNRRYETAIAAYDFSTMEDWERWEICQRVGDEVLAAYDREQA